MKIMSQLKMQVFNKSLTSERFGPTLRLWPELLSGHRTAERMVKNIAQKTELGEPFRLTAVGGLRQALAPSS